MQRQIDYTLKVMEDIRIKSSVSEKKIDYVIKKYRTTGIKIELFQDNKRIRSITLEEIPKIIKEHI